jgi:hypothetical protein
MEGPLSERTGVVESGMVQIGLGGQMSVWLDLADDCTNGTLLRTLKRRDIGCGKYA